tara:strand:- start:300 stop:455 length:156 start_codon:yes stop_codon:yes gene_type:complete
MKTNLERIKEVLNLDVWRKKQKKLFRRKILSIFLAIGLILAALYIYINYGQ